MAGKVLVNALGDCYWLWLWLCLCCRFPVEFALDSFSLSRSLSVSVYGIIELRGLMAAASLIWLSPLPHATCPKLTQAALANVKVLCKVFCVVLIARSLRQLVVVVGVLLLLLLLMLLLL